MKKVLFMLTFFLFAGIWAYSQVTVEKEGEGAKVTWTYTPDYDAAFVGLVGDFQGWNLDAALPMAKNEDGSWSVTMELGANEEVKYKFSVDGEWAEDPKAPLTSDDGFGGLNGYVIVADLLAGAGGAAPSQDRLFFGTYTSLRLVSEYEEAAALTQLRANSYLKFQGKILPQTDLFMEVQYLQGELDLYRQDEGFLFEEMGSLLSRRRSFRAPFRPF